jgi:hypothetical protein
MTAPRLKPLPCPFCGKQVRRAVRNRMVVSHPMLRWPPCPANGYHDIGSWNTRATPRKRKPAGRGRGK